MEITVRKLADVQIIQLKGAVRLGQAVDTFRQAIDDACAAGDVNLVISCADVPVIDSSGIGVMVKSLTTAKSRGGDVRLVNPSKFVIQTLRLIGVLKLFTVFEAEDLAVESFNT